mmetsp:Transcript_60198/g.130547  ORF Transcript_60198/g.130547 Transcript_60198/m.130547 type:complete len:159 (+) Transcript_60198:30-506(+)
MKDGSLRHRHGGLSVLCGCCVATAVTLWRSATPATFVGAATPLTPPSRSVISAGAGKSDPNAGDEKPSAAGEMTLEEERRRGMTLEAEFSKVLEARRQGRDIKREPGIEPANDFEVAARKAQRQLSGLVPDVQPNPVTVFWGLLIGLIICGWLVSIFH